jgi:hypothetical protein
MHINFTHVRVNTADASKQDCKVFDILVSHLPRQSNGFDLIWNVGASRQYINAMCCYHLSDSERLTLTIKFPRKDPKNFRFVFGNDKSRQMVKANYLLYMLYDKLSDVYNNL